MSMIALEMFAIFSDEGTLTKIVAKEQDRPSVRDITTEIAVLLQRSLSAEIDRLQSVESTYEQAQSEAEDRRWC